MQHKITISQHTINLQATGNREETAIRMTRSLTRKKPGQAKSEQGGKGQGQDPEEADDSNDDDRSLPLVRQRSLARLKRMRSAKAKEEEPEGADDSNEDDRKPLAQKGKKEKERSLL